MSAFYGQVIRNKFPNKSKIQSEDSSLGGKLLSAFGDHIEENFRSSLFRNALGKNFIKDDPLSVFEHLNNAELISNDTYSTSVFGKEVSTVSIDNKTEARSLKELFESLPSYYTAESNFDLTGIEPLVKTVVTKIVDEKMSLKEETRLFIDVKKIKGLTNLATSSSISIKLCGKNKKGFPVEETLIIDSERLYQTKTKFYSLETIGEDISRNIDGGFAVEVNSMNDFEFDILRLPIQNFTSINDIYEYERKRIEVQNFLSVGKALDIRVDQAVRENTLLVDLVNYKNENDEEFSKFVFIHRYFKSISSYKRNLINITDDDRFFDSVIGEVSLLNDTGDNILAVDFCYDEITNSLICLTEEGKVYYYKVGNADFYQNKVARTKNTPIRIDTIDDKFLPGESFTIRLLTGNIELPLKNFIIGKTVDDIEDTQWLQADKSTWSDTISIFFPILNAEDLQDSLEIFYFEDSLSNSSTEYFIIEFESNLTNSNYISNYNLLQNKNVETLISYFKNKDKTTVNSKIILSNSLKPKLSFTNILMDEFNYSGIFLKDNNRKLYVKLNNNHICFIPEYNNFYYDGQDIYSKDNIPQGSIITFNLKDSTSVEVTL